MITSLRNPRIAEVRRLQRRKERRAIGRTTIEGPFLLQEAIAGGATVRGLFALPGDTETQRIAERAGIDVTAVSDEVLHGMAASVNPRGPVAVIDIPQPAQLQAIDTIVLWEIADPGNVGTLIRTAAAFGFQVVATAGCADLWSPKVMRAGVGAHFRTPVVEGIGTSMELLDEAGLVSLATAASGIDVGKIDLSDENPVALIIGNEAHGLPDLVTRRVTTVAIPMPGGIESLNAAVAGGVLMYLRRSRCGLAIAGDGG